MTETACPDPDRLAAWVGGRLSASDQKEISDHLVDCERCYGTVAATVRFLGGGGPTDDVAPKWALAPAIVTAVVMASALTVSLLLLGHVP